MRRPDESGPATRLVWVVTSCAVAASLTIILVVFLGAASRQPAAILRPTSAVPGSSMTTG